MISACSRRPPADPVLQVLAVAALLASFLICSPAFAENAIGSRPPLLIILFSEADPQLDPLTVIEQIAANARGEPSDKGLLRRLGDPISGAWLIQDRLIDIQLDRLHGDNPPLARLQRYVVLGFADEKATDAALSTFRHDSGIESAVPETIGRFAMVPNDTFIQTTPSAAPSNYQWGLEAINVMSPYSSPGSGRGWEIAKGYGYVSVIDQGIDIADGVVHPDLQKNFRQHMSQAFFNVTCSGQSLTNLDEFGPSGTCGNSVVGHGTHVMGIIGAAPDNGIGVAGVCWYCSLISAKVAQGNSPLTTNVVNAIVKAIQIGAQVVNLSAGVPSYMASYGVGVFVCAQISMPDPYCDVLAAASAQDIIVVAAAGNSSRDPLRPGSSDPPPGVDFPASEPTAISVGAVQRIGPSSYSLWHDDQNPPGSPLAGTNYPDATHGKIDLVAPGRRVISTFYRGQSYNDNFGYDLDCSDYVNGLSGSNLGYDQCTGTSMATPFVTGAAIVARSIDPLKTAAQILATLKSTGITVGAGSRFPSGLKMPDMLQAEYSLAVGNSSVTPVFSLSATGQSTRLFTVAPQMGSAALAGTMLPRHNAGAGFVFYAIDPSAAVTSGYPSFPAAGSHGQPRAYFKAYTRYQIGGIDVLPLYRLSKVQNVASGVDACGTSMPVPGKAVPVLHTYTTSDVELGQLTAQTAGYCFNLDGIEGYVAPWNFGGLEQLYRIYNPTADSYILVPSSKLSIASANGYTQNQTSLGWVIPN